MFMKEAYAIKKIQ